MGSVLVEQHLAQRGAKLTCFEVGQLGKTAAGQLDLDHLVCSPSEVKRCPTPIAITTHDRAVLPTQAAKQHGGGYAAGRPRHRLGLFRIIPSPWVPAVAIACRKVGFGGWLAARR
jgi:hypothetical protein